LIKEFIEMPKLEKLIGNNFSFLSPNTWTTLSLLIAIIAFFVAIRIDIYLGFTLFILSTLCDFIDGKVARHNNTASAFGAFWDGTVDRVVDALLLAVFFFLDLPVDKLFLGVFLYILLFTTILPPFIVAYANHRGAVPDPTEKVIWRFAHRVEYLVFYSAALVFYPFSPQLSYYLLWCGLILMSATVIQSIYLVFIKSKLYL
jgi:archaetidylinositol phosphate synthase